MISSINIKHFRSHHATALQFKRVNFFFGHPGSGKSTTLDALVTALLGKNRFTDAAGKGIREDITVGQPQAQIECEVKGVQVCRQISAKNPMRLAFPNSPPNLAAAQDRLLTQLGANEEAILCLLDPSNIFEKDEATQQKILVRLMRPTEIAVPEAVKAIGITQLVGAADIDARIKQLKEIAIRDLNSEIKVLEEAIRNSPESVPDITPTREELKRVQDLHKGQIESRTRAARYAIDVLNAQGEVNKHRGVPVPPPRPLSAILEEADKIEAQKRDLAEKIKQANALLSTASDEQKVAHQAASLAGSQADAVAGMGAQCGVVAEFECPLTRKEKDKMVILLRSRATEHQKKFQQCGSNSDVVVKRIVGLQDEVRDLDDQLANFEKEKRAARAEQDRQADLAAAEAKLAELVAKPAEAVSDQVLANTEAKLAELNATIASANVAAQGITNRAIKVKACDAKRAECERQQAAVAALTELKASILKQGSDGFLSAMTPLLHPFGMGQVEFQASPYSLKVMGVSVRRLSSGQKLLFDAALRVAAAKHTGVGAFAIDDSNRLDDASRAQLQQVLGKSGCQVFICRTLDKPPAPEVVKKLPTDCAAMWFSADTITGPTKIEVL